MSLSHEQVLELLEQMIGQHRSRVPEDAGLFLEHYVDTLRRLTMQDSELVDLCKTIYRKHRSAINLIVEYGAASQVLDAVRGGGHGNQFSRTFTLTPQFPCLVCATRKWPSTSRRSRQVGRSCPRRYPLAWWFYHGKKRGSCGDLPGARASGRSKRPSRLFSREAKECGVQVPAGGAHSRATVHANPQEEPISSK